MKSKFFLALLALLPASLATGFDLFDFDLLDALQEIFAAPTGWLMCALICGCVLASGTADAALTTNSWINSGDGFWHVGLNWSLGVTPSSNQTAVLITNAATKTVFINSLSAGLSGVMTISNLTMRGVETNNTLFLNSSGTNVPLRILNGFILGTNAVLRVTNSVLRVDGLSGGVLSIDGSVTNLARGQIIVTNTTTIVGDSSRGSLTLVDGLLQGRVMLVGNAAGSQGTLTIAGGTNTLSSFFDVGQGANATGAVWLTGGQLTATNSLTEIGFQGVGQMTVSNGTWRASTADVGYIGGSANGTLTIAGGTNTLSGSLFVGTFGGTTGAVWLTGGQLTVENGEINVGHYGMGQMTVTNGTWLAPAVNVGFNAGSHGTLTVAGGTNTLSASLTIGLEANATGAVFVTGGQLTVTNASTVIGSNGVGQVTQSGGTMLCRNVVVGLTNGAQGTLTVTGGTNQLISTLEIGLAANATGAVWLTGGELVVTNDNTRVGVRGAGQMTVSNGTWRTRFADVGESAGSSGTLTIAGGNNTLLAELNIGTLANATGAVWLTGGQLVVTNLSSVIGFDGVGQMTVSNGTWLAKDIYLAATSTGHGTLTVAGGTVTGFGLLLIAADSNSTNTVWVTGGRLTLTNNSTYIGSEGAGQMTVSNGTTLLRDVHVASNPSSQGTLTVAGGTSSVYSNLIIGNFPCTPTGAVVVAGGNLFVTNSTVSAVLEVRTGTLTLNSGVLMVDKFVMTNACAHFVRTGGTLIYGSAVLSSNRDDDGDGIPNGYELSHGLDPLNPFDAASDNDGDGFSNLQEFQAGTDPTNSASALRITAIARVANTNILVTWTMGVGKTNALQRTAGQPDGSYSTNNFATIFTVTNTVGTVTNYLDVGAMTNFPSRYYRVRLLP